MVDASCMYDPKMQKGYDNERKSFFSGRKFGWWVAVFVIVDVLLSTAGIIVSVMVHNEDSAIIFCIISLSLASAAILIALILKALKLRSGSDGFSEDEPEYHFNICLRESEYIVTDNLRDPTRSQTIKILAEGIYEITGMADDDEDESEDECDDDDDEPIALLKPGFNFRPLSDQQVQKASLTTMAETVWVIDASIDLTEADFKLLSLGRIEYEEVTPVCREDGTTIGFSLNNFELGTDFVIMVNPDGSIQYDILN